MRLRIAAFERMDAGKLDRGEEMTNVSQELIAILAVGVVVIGSHWRLDDDIDALDEEIDDLRGRIIKLETARITGTATASTGGFLSDVMVVASPALLPGGDGAFTDSKGAHTDDTGRYTIDGLRPGVYTLTFILQDSSVTKRQEVSVSAGFTEIVDAEL